MWQKRRFYHPFSFVTVQAARSYGKNSASKKGETDSASGCHFFIHWHRSDELNWSDVNNRCLFPSSCRSVSQCRCALDANSLNQWQHRFCQHTEPRYSLPSRHYFPLPAFQDMEATHIQKLLDSSVNDISFHNRYMELRRKSDEYVKPNCSIRR